MEKIDELSSPKLRRRALSFSTISDLTVKTSTSTRVTLENSVAVTNNFSIENYVKNLTGTSKNNFKIENSNKIRVGDVFYNIYYEEEGKEKLF